MSRDATDRREFLRRASAALTIVSTGATAGETRADPARNDAAKKAADPVSKFQPEEFWKDRMRAPDEGKPEAKRYGWFVDTRRCFGCHGCEVSCKAENDVPLGQYIRQTIYKDVGEYPKVARLFMPMSCQHCEDAPCIKACPCGALHKRDGGTVAIDYDTCCGHGTCAEVCPYGAIYLDPVAKQAVKCHNCYHRVETGDDDGPMEPACVPTCPAEALYFGDLNDPESKINKAMEQAEDFEGVRAKERGAEFAGFTQLRTEKGTKPRMWFAGRAAAEIEERIPREGQSYSPEAYNLYAWKDAPTIKGPTS